MKKPKGIVITTSEATEQWFDECYASIAKLGYPILVVINGVELDQCERMESEHMTVYVNNWNGYELGGIQRGTEEFDEFVHLMDTCVVTDGEMIHKMFEHDGSVHLCRGFFSYIGKYVSKIVIKTGIPKVTDKEQAIHHERHWNVKYLANDPKAIQFDPELPVTTDVFEEKNGRNNMILDNGFIKKWKGTWR
jgi:hypothetical protein